MIESKDENVTVFKLTGSDVVTGAIAKGAGIEGKLLEKFVEVAAGNPGCANYLLELKTSLSSDIDFELALVCFKVKQLTGSELYSTIKSKGVNTIISEMRASEWI